MRAPRGLVNSILGALFFPVQIHMGDLFPYLIRIWTCKEVNARAVAGVWEEKAALVRFTITLL